jgi:hypothetical protein
MECFDADADGEINFREFSVLAYMLESRSNPSIPPSLHPSIPPESEQLRFFWRIGISPNPLNPKQVKIQRKRAAPILLAHWYSD